MRLRLRASTAEDLRAIGAAIAPLLVAGDAIALGGDLGAGKTTLAQGLARGLGIAGPVTSPTFTLVREYPHGRLPLLHADVYRLDRVQDVLDLALEEDAEGGVLVVEWGDVIEALLPQEHLVIELTVAEPGDDREVFLRADGDTWTLRAAGLERALGAWLVAA
ncbi:MAG TPA: tRNA (adenosine(37)-N6)-threonylcarbamoyltransferase complex ATPase subunit type 1 TsaE [Actinomycetota bacterium]|jgi:tRNA threonylcarbamoyladenosine biosynthesis protein TsaE